MVTPNQEIATFHVIGKIRVEAMHRNVLYSAADPLLSATLFIYGLLKIRHSIGQVRA
jgi:hypothetical protein